MGAPYLTADELSAMQGLPALDAQQAALQRQAELAQMLMGGPRRQHTTGLGALLGGLGDTASGLAGTWSQLGTNKKMDALAKQRAAGEAAGAKFKTLMGMKQLSAADQDLAAGAQRMGLEKQEGDAKAAARARLLDPASPRATMGAEFLRRMGLGVPEGATAEDIEAQVPSATRLEISKQAAQDRALQRRGMMDLKAERLRQGLEEREVGGYDFAPGRLPSKDNAKKFTQAVTAVNGMMGDLDALEENFKAHGTESFFGADQTRQSSARESIILQLKELQNLGVLNGKDYEILSRIVPDTASPGAMFSRNSTLEAQFGEFRRQLENRLQAGASAMGYAKTGAPTPSPGAPAGLSPEKQKRLEELRAKAAAGALR